MIINRNPAAVAEARFQALEEARKAAIARINAEVGRVRERYITTIPGQDMIYQAKEAEALRWMAEQPAALDAYPFIAAEVGVLAPTAEDVALIWLGMSQHWRTVAAVLEGLRMTAVNAINAADTAEAIEIHVEGFHAQANAL